MSWLQIVVLAVVQGVTEFLPISSSGHLALVPIFTGWPDQGLAIDAASHLGTLAAVLIYFRRDVGRLIVGFLRLIGGRRDADGQPDAWGKLAGYIIIGTIPVVIAGLLIEHYLGDALRNVEIIAWTMPLVGILLYLVDRFAARRRNLDQLRLGDALLIGCAQVLALVPGTSRSGITMVTARLLKFERTDAARFSFLLSIPATAAAGAYEGYKIYETGNVAIAHDAIAVILLTALAGLAAIALLMAWLRRASFTPFAAYRLALGALLLYLVYLR